MKAIDLALITHGCRLTFIDLRHGQITPMAKPSEPLVLCLGNFDGVHLAHTTLLRQAIEFKKSHLPHALCGVFTFFYPSFDYLRAHKTPEHAASPAEMQSHVIKRKKGHHRHLTTLKEKLLRFAGYGMDFVCLCDFDDIRTLSPDEFLTLLRHNLGAVGAVCGFNFRFGAGGVGTSEQIYQAFNHPDKGLYAAVMPPFCMDGDAVSSTRIRKMLLGGECVLARRHMGHPYALSNVVVHGKHLGRAWGFPTANQYFLPESLIPARGVYAVLCHTPHGIYPGVANIGSHPTVDENAPVNCETHIIGYEHDIYGYRMKVEFLYHLRGEMKFPTEADLRNQIQKDIQDALTHVNAYLQEQPLFQNSKEISHGQSQE